MKAQRKKSSPRLINSLGSSYDLFFHGCDDTYPHVPFGMCTQARSNYSLDCPDELLALLELEVDDDEESDVAELGPAFGQHTLQ